MNRPRSRQRRRSSSNRNSTPLLALLGVAMLVLSNGASEQANTMQTDAASSLPFLRRSTADSSTSSPDERKHYITRIYGPENAAVRRAVSELEERHPRFQTGLPRHSVTYENHPFEQKQQSNGKDHRHLQDSDLNDLYKPIRICHDTTALESQRSAETGAQIDFLLREVIPRMEDFWTMALSVVPISGNLVISADELDNRAYCGDSEFTEVDVSHISQGVPDCDLMLYFSGTPSTRYCDTSTLAVAVACNFDQFDRPIAGAINFCLDTIKLNGDGTASQAVIQDNVDVAIHEAAHVLGMSSNSYRFFWDPETGAPRTERPFSAQTVTCVDGVTRTQILPAKTTMEFFLAENGQRYASIVTPKVRAVARNQFDCQSIAGAQLENQPTGSNSCTGDHFDERLWYPEALSGVISPTTNILSPLTLALMEDSGWYKANYTMGRSSPWGLGAGCSFVKDPCLIPGDPPSVPDYGRGYFCNQPAYRGCSPALTHKLSCTVLDYEYLSTPNPEAQFEYFTAAATRGGPRQADYCPLFGSVYVNEESGGFDCTNPNHSPDLNVFNEAYGEDSMCVETDGGEARCFRAACIKEDMAVEINVRGKWYTCEYDFMTFDVFLGSGLVPTRVTCPRLSTACPDLFCPFNCAGRGVCNYANVENGVVRPRCECFDETDTTAGCSESLIPDGKYLDDAGGLVDDLEEGFFDPLVAVFVDHPEKWTTASWAWAGGLIALFVVLMLCICSAFWPEGKRSKQVSVSRAGSF